MSSPTPFDEVRARLRRTGGALVVDNLFRALAKAGRYHPNAEPSRHGVEVTRDVPYAHGPSGMLGLDIYRPKRSGSKPPPVVLYVHGGGFRILSKDTHWVMGLAFARRGYLVLSIDYRLAPAHPFPAAIEDASRALVWTVENAERLGGDPNQIVLAGESAGGNLVTALAVATCYERPEPYAREVFATGVVPRAVLPACGILQVTDPRRFARRKATLPSFIQDRIDEVSRAYLESAVPHPEGGLEMADPLLIVEQQKPARALPPFFIPVGTKDPILDDSRRLKAALDKMDVPAELAVYPGEGHAFHALVWRENAKRCWGDTYTFLDRWIDRR